MYKHTQLFINCQKHIDNKVEHQRCGLCNQYHNFASLLINKWMHACLFKYLCKHA